MKQVRLNIILKIPFVVFGTLFTTYCIMDMLYRYDCSIRFDIGKYQDVTYFLRENNSQFSPDYSLLSETDYERLINVAFTFTIQNLVCDDATPLLLILIHSAPTNHAKRRVIRETWGKSEENVKLLFLMGTTDDPDTEDQLRKENFLHNDLLQGSFLDSYRNLTYKHVMVLKYVIYHCPRAKYILKVDDDVCINMPTFKNFLMRDLSPHGAENLIMCNAIRNGRALRGYRTKWMVTLTEYREKYYPTFCLGWCILYSPDVVFRLYVEAQRGGYLWIDDVYITGILAAKLGSVYHTDISPLTLSRREIRRKNKCRPFLFGKADMSESEIRSLWEQIINNPVPRSVNLLGERYE